MRVVIAGEIDLEPGQREGALAGARAHIDAALAQPGCRHYAWTADPFDANRIHVFEEWDDQDDLARHLKGPAYFGMLGHMRGFGIRAADTRKYRVDAAEPVYGADGVASAEFRTAAQR